MFYFQHILKKATDWGVEAKVLAELRYDLANTLKFHKKTTVDIEVDFIRLSHKKSWTNFLTEPAISFSAFFFFNVCMQVVCMSVFLLVCIFTTCVNWYPVVVNKLLLLNYWVFRTRISDSFVMEDGNRYIHIFLFYIHPNVSEVLLFSSNDFSAFFRKWILINLYIWIFFFFNAKSGSDAFIFHIFPQCYPVL